MLIIVTILINVGAIATWSFITGQNGFKEAAKMLRGEAAFIRDSNGEAIELDPAVIEQYGPDYDPNKGAITEGTERTSPYDPRFGIHPDDPRLPGNQ